jgi:surface carbohydrate biosynthesis protein (TIGR04326 family)
MRWLIVLDDEFDYSNEVYDKLITLNSVPDVESFSLIDYVFENNHKLGLALSNNLEKLSLIKQDKDSKNIASILELEDGISYWHLSGATERCIVRNPSLEDYYTFLAIINCIGSQEVEALTVLGASRMLVTRLLERFPNSKNISILKKSETKLEIINNAYKLFKLVVSSLIAFLKIFHSILFSKKYKSNKEIIKEEINFFCYSDNMELNAQGGFRSKYFRDISEQLESSNKKICWYHLYDASKGLSRNSIIENLLTQEQLDSSTQLLRLIDGYSNFSNYLKIFPLYFKLQKARKKVESILDNTDHEDNSPWPFVKDHWSKTVSGGTSVKFLYQMIMLREMVRNVVSDQGCIFLCEGMLWERVLVYYWQKHKTTPIYGCIHSSIKSLDFRLTFYEILDNKYRPNLFLYPSNTNTKRLNDFQLQDAWLRKVSPISSDILNSSTKNLSFEDRKNYIGIVLDGINEIDSWLISMLESLIMGGHFKGKRFILKPHPNVPIVLSDKVSSNDILEITDSTLIDLITRCPIVISSISSSAAIMIEANAESYFFFHKPGHLIRTPLPKISAKLILFDQTSFLNTINNHLEVYEDREFFHSEVDDKISGWEEFLN